MLEGKLGMESSTSDTRGSVEAPIEESSGRQPFKTLGEEKCSAHWRSRCHGDGLTSLCAPL